MKLAEQKFVVAFGIPADKDFAGTMLYFGSSPEDANYDSGSIVFITAPKDGFKFPEDKPDLILPVTKDGNIYIKAASQDTTGNLSDLTEAIIIPFDQVPPGMITNLRVVQ